VVRPLRGGGVKPPEPLKKILFFYDKKRTLCNTNKIHKKNMLVQLSVGQYGVPESFLNIKMRSILVSGSQKCISKNGKKYNHS